MQRKINSRAFTNLRDLPPWIMGHVQSFFGLAETPTVGEGKITLQLRLLAPNGRVTQITDNLPRFWQEGYATVKQELARRYPKHHWPDDPAVAEPVLLKRYVRLPRTP